MNRSHFTVSLRLYSQRAAYGVIRLYQLLVSPWIGVHCRFTPSCSHYAQEALFMHGFLKGLWLAVRRILRCHPWGAHGEDPVPPSSSHITL